MTLKEYEKLIEAEGKALQSEKRLKMMNQNMITISPLSMTIRKKIKRCF